MTATPRVPPSSRGGVVDGGADAGLLLGHDTHDRFGGRRAGQAHADTEQDHLADDLEADRLVEVDRQPGRREVWCRLTPAGADLQPTLDELLPWGLRHFAEPPRPDEPTHPEHLLWALRLQLDREGVDIGWVRWVVQVPGTGVYVLRGQRRSWDLQTDADDDGPADVTITASRSALARFLTTPPPREPRRDGVQIAGKAAATQTFLRAIEVFPVGMQAVAT